jgi:chromate reductase, NAD(P)H dehydrogenase (quinone)
MTNTRNVAVIVGSLRKESFNRMAANVLTGVAPSHLHFEMLDIGGLQLYNQDVEENPYAPWIAFRDKIRVSDAILFVSPEYNRSIPGALKNAIDVASRPSANNAWKRKPAAIMTVSIGSAGGTAAGLALRQACMAVDIAVMPQPEAFIGRAGDLFGDDGTLKKDDTREVFRKFMLAFSTWIEAIRSRE